MDQLPPMEFMTYLKNRIFVEIEEKIFWPADIKEYFYKYRFLTQISLVMGVLMYMYGVGIAIADAQRLSIISTKKLATRLR